MLTGKLLRQELQFAKLYPPFDLHEHDFIDCYGISVPKMTTYTLQSLLPQPRPPFPKFYLRITNKTYQCVFIMWAKSPAPYVDQGLLNHVEYKRSLSVFGTFHVARFLICYVVFHILLIVFWSFSFFLWHCQIIFTLWEYPLGIFFSYIDNFE